VSIGGGRQDCRCDGWIPERSQILAGSPVPFGRFLQLWAFGTIVNLRRKQACPYPLVGARHCKGHMVLIASVAVSPTPRAILVVEALDILEGEFASGNVGADLLDHPVMADQGFGDPAIN
jgi:hypothetical protein